MTAEIAVLNNSAVALAADSLVTISQEQFFSCPHCDHPIPKKDVKTYEVNKLFTISKHHPVGIMVYDAAEFSQLPWETIIKAYRKNLGTASFDTIQEYAENFLDWIAASPLVSQMNVSEVGSVQCSPCITM